MQEKEGPGVTCDGVGRVLLTQQIRLRIGLPPRQLVIQLVCAAVSADAQARCRRADTPCWRTYCTGYPP